MDPNFISIIDKVKAIHEAKNYDYSREDKPYSNFEFTEKFLELFGNDMPSWCIPYLALIGTKLGRLRELLKGKVPKNESILDTFIDLVAYTGLWGARYLVIPQDALKPENSIMLCSNCLKNAIHPSFVPFCSQGCKDGFLYT